MSVRVFVLSQKLHPPRSSGLPRRRLIEPLLRADAPPLVLVSAPAGSGKTTLLAQVAQAAMVPVGWYRVGADDISEPAFVGHLGRALGDALGIGTATCLAVEDLLVVLDRWSGGDALLVLDDLHDVLGSPAEAALERFLRLRPPNLRVLMGARRAPGLNLPRLMVSDGLLELGGEDLRFRSWEVEQLFVEVYGEPLPPEAAAALTQRTGGWAAGLQMFHLATAGKPAAERRHAVASLGGRSRLVRSYLVHNVLAEVASERRHFLTRTCALGTLTGPLCDALLETTGSIDVLSELEQRQLFTSSDDDGLTFRYHQVLQAHLEVALLEELGPQAARGWYARCAVLLEEGGLPREALRAAARADDWTSVARLISRNGPEFVAGVPPEELLPRSLREHDPWLALTEARRRFRHGAIAGAVEAYRRAEALLEDPEFRGLCRRERALTAVWLPEPSWNPVRRSGLPLPLRTCGEQVRAATRRIPYVGEQTFAGPAVSDRLAAGLVDLLAGNWPRVVPLLESVAADYG